MPIGSRCAKCEYLEKVVRKARGEVSRAMDGAGPLESVLDRQGAAAVLGILDGLLSVSQSAKVSLTIDRGERYGHHAKRRHP